MKICQEKYAEKLNTNYMFRNIQRKLKFATFKSIIVIEIKKNND